jgi:hypothetical protein
MISCPRCQTNQESLQAIPGYNYPVCQSCIESALAICESNESIPKNCPHITYVPMKGPRERDWETTGTLSAIGRHKPSHAVYFTEEDKTALRWVLKCLTKAGEYETGDTSGINKFSKGYRALH